MAAAPLRGNRLDIIGTLAISYREPRDVPESDQELLQGLADVAAIAVANSRLYQELHDSERRYHYLLSDSPDIVWQTDREGVFTFLSDSLRARRRGARSRPAGCRISRRSCIPIRGAIPEETYRRIGVAPFPEAQSYRFYLRTGTACRCPWSCAPWRTRRRAAMAAPTASCATCGTRSGWRTTCGGRPRTSGSAQERAQARPGPPRLGHPGAVQHDAHDPERGAAHGPRSRRPRGRCWASCASWSARPSPRCVPSSSSCDPANLEQDGLVQAIRTHAAGIQGRVGLAVRVECDVPDHRAPLDVETALYRITQEALHNVVKHADANTVSIRLVGVARTRGCDSRSRTMARGSTRTSSRPATSASRACARGRARSVPRSMSPAHLVPGTRIEVHVPVRAAGRSARLNLHPGRADAATSCDVGHIRPDDRCRGLAVQPTVAG